MTAQVQELDFGIPCQNGECDNAAEWIVRSKCCEHIALYCDEHMRLLLSILSSFNKMGYACRCPNCGVFHSVALDAYFRPEKI